MKKLVLLLFLSVSQLNLKAQELLATVQLLAPTVTNSNKSSLAVLQKTISDFLNNNKWSNETYLPPERINCHFIITLTSWDGAATYTAKAQIQSRRPVYATSYQSTLLNLSDQNFDFSYNEGQALEFSDQNYQSNLASLLSYYAYTILGADKDSFSKLGGSAYYLKALNILNLAQNNGHAGWRAVDGLRNRYWLNENLLNKSDEPLRVFSYYYHRKGLDIMQENTGRALKDILSYLPALQQMDKQRLGSVFNNTFFAAKATEFVNLFSQANPLDRVQAYNLLLAIDPANSSKYDQLKNRP
ncbi:hypothetical protein AAKU52_000375 [Pedobacter sp. CG_S7]|uniref:type IX secretion system protein PorD n=1 Tax=Pedobacter sp. CG_S7 TaxID=3143930 RepID=UPI003399BAFE